MTDFENVLDDLNYFLYSLMQKNKGKIPPNTKWRSPVLLDSDTYEKLLNESVCYQAIKGWYKIDELKDVCSFIVEKTLIRQQTPMFVFSVLNIIAAKSGKKGRNSFNRINKNILES